MPLTGLRDAALKLILFGGKGGVGKTTCASSAGLYLSKDFKTLLVSTDPAHSLSDSLGYKIGDEITQVPLTHFPLPKGERVGVRGQLSALEVSAQKALSQFKKDYEGQIKRILDTSTYLDKEDMDAVFSLPIPGMDEVMGFKAIVDLIEEARFEKYIVDTAPTGHALRLLGMPKLLDDWVKVMARLRWKYRYMVETFSGRYNPDEGDDFLMEMKKTVKRIEGLLRDQNRCEFIPVTIPESMAILETERLINSLNRFGIKVRQLVINNVLESGKPRTFKKVRDRDEFWKEKRREQAKYIKEIRRKFRRLKMTIMPLFPCEVKGIEALNNFKEMLFKSQFRIKFWQN